MTGDIAKEGELLICGRCGTPFDADDSFCRRCGAPLTSRVPAVRREYPPPTVWSPPAQLVVRGAAVVAAGALAEIVVRRLIRRLFRPRNFLPTLRGNRPSVRLVRDEGEEPGPEPDAQIESETIVLRQVRLRRRRNVDE